MCDVFNILGDIARHEVTSPFARLCTAHALVVDTGVAEWNGMSMAARSHNLVWVEVMESDTGPETAYSCEPILSCQIQCRKSRPLRAFMLEQLGALLIKMHAQTKCSKRGDAYQSCQAYARTMLSVFLSKGSTKC